MGTALDILYRKKNEAWFLGKRVRARQRLETGYQSIAAGAVLVICGKFKGFTLETERCDHCGVSVYIRKVAPPYNGGG